MGYNTAATEWPQITNVSKPVKELIDRFFLLLDNDKADDVGDTLADTIFSQDGTAYFGGHAFQGREQIRKSRDNAWLAISSRRHEVRKIYVSNEDCDDLLFIGWVAMGIRKNGKVVEGEFTGRLKIVDSNTESPRLSLYQVWADSGPLVKAMQED